MIGNVRRMLQRHEDEIYTGDVAILRCEDDWKISPKFTTEGPDADCFWSEDIDEIVDFLLDTGNALTIDDLIIEDEFFDDDDCGPKERFSGYSAVVTMKKG